MRTEKLNNLLNLLKSSVAKGYYGEVKIKFEDGNISIVEKIDKIKLDNESYKRYKGSIK